MLTNWEQEFKKQGIPSSFKSKPSHASYYFYDFLQSHSLIKGSLLDVGCGKGRNSHFFASNNYKVTAIDLLPSNISYIKNSLKKSFYNIHLLTQDLADPWLLNDNSFDYAIDIFCFKHLTKNSEIHNYMKELNRVLRPQAYFLLSLAAYDDGYYGPLLTNSSKSKGGKIIDPKVNIPSILYSQREIRQLFESVFQIIDIEDRHTQSLMHGKSYPRHILNFIMKKVN